MAKLFNHYRPYLFVANFYLLLSFYSLNATAAVFSVDDIDGFGVSALTRDSKQGLDFLDVTFSTNLTFDAVEAQLGVGGIFEGYRFASIEEVVTLINNYGFSPTAVAFGDTVGSTDSDQISQLVDMMGQTLIIDAHRATVGLTGTSSGEYQYFVRINDSLDSNFNDQILAASLGSKEGIKTPFSGHYLVKQFFIFEPATISLIALGLVLLAYRHKKCKAIRKI